MFYSSEFCDLVYSWLVKIARKGCRKGSSESHFFLKNSLFLAPWKKRSISWIYSNFPKNGWARRSLKRKAKLHVKISRRNLSQGATLHALASLFSAVSAKFKRTTSWSLSPQELISSFLEPTSRFRVLIGDPGRNFLNEHHHLLDKCKAVYSLDYPKQIQNEYPGFHTGTVYELAHTDLIWDTSVVLTREFLDNERTRESCTRRKNL